MFHLRSTIKRSIYTNRISNISITKDNRVLIPSYIFLAIHDKDFMYTEAECPRSSQYYLCEDRLNQHYRSQGDCIHHLITTQQIDRSCQYTIAKLRTEAVEALDDRHYVASFPVPTKVRLSCTGTQYNTIQRSYLITIPVGWDVQTPDLTLANKDDRLKGQILKIMNIPSSNVTSHDTEPKRLTLNSTDLRSLHVATEEISMETPLTLNESGTFSVYYTITPLYLILLSASALGIAFALRKRIKRRSLKTTLEQTNDEVERGDVYAEVSNHTAAAQPRLSALFSNQSSNSR